MEEIDKAKNKLTNLGFNRKTWTPITRVKKGKITDSKFCGKPILLKNEEWPKCGKCSNELQLFLQLNLEELPKEYTSKFSDNFTGYIQLFYCTNEEEECGNVCIFNDGDDYSYHLVRFINKEDIDISIKVKVPNFDPNFKEKVIVGWEQEEDEFPNGLEKNYSVFNLDIEKDIKDQIAYGQFDGDKIGGWAFWIQDKEEDTCLSCNKDKKILIQIGSDDNIPYTFADGGIGHIFICPEHKNDINFYWDCY